MSAPPGPAPSVAGAAAARRDARRGAAGGRGVAFIEGIGFAPNSLVACEAIPASAAQVGPPEAPPHFITFYYHR